MVKFSLFPLNFALKSDLVCNLVVGEIVESLHEDGENAHLKNGNDSFVIEKSVNESDALPNHSDDINRKNRFGQTALHVAVEMGMN